MNTIIYITLLSIASITPMWLAYQWLSEYSRRRHLEQLLKDSNSGMISDAMRDHFVAWTERSVENYRNAIHKVDQLNELVSTRLMQFLNDIEGRDNSDSVKAAQLKKEVYKLLGL